MMMVNKIKFKYKDLELDAFVDEDYHIYYVHPLTGAICQELSQVFYGWSEQNPQRRVDWGSFADKINNDEDISDWIDQSDKNETIVAQYYENGKEYYHI